MSALVPSPNPDPLEPSQGSQLMYGSDRLPVRKPRVWFDHQYSAPPNATADMTYHRSSFDKRNSQNARAAAI